MKHQQVVVDYWSMVKTSCTCLLLALSGYILIKMVQTIFWLPGYLQNNQKRLEELAAQYSVQLNDDDEGESKGLNGQEEKQPLTDEKPEAEKAESTATEPKKEK